jgi:hypothetical protein
VDPRAGRKAGAENLAPHRDSILGPSSPYSVAIPTELPGLPLFFCITTIPLTNELNRLDYGYPVHRTERKVSQSLYMDDLKLQVRSEEDLENEIIIVKTISKEVNMNFGLEKYAKICLKS